MSKSNANTCAVLIGLWFVLVSPPVRHGLEGTMLTHMLLHIPALVLIGWSLGEPLIRTWPQAVPWFGVFRWTFLLVSMFTLGVWMIPRWLDLATEHADLDLVKALSLTLGGGLCLRLGWHQIGPVAKGLIHIEAMASLMRLGWLYVESPTRLCTSYGLADQYALGRILLVMGSLYAAAMAARALCCPLHPMDMTSGMKNVYPNH